MRRSSQSGNQQLKQHLLSGLQCRKRLVADILFWDGKQWGKNLAPSNGSTVSYQYPIAMSTVLGGFANAYGTSTDISVRFVEKTTATFSLDSSGTDVNANWLAIGR